MMVEAWSEGIVIDPARRRRKLKVRNRIPGSTAAQCLGARKVQGLLTEEESAAQTAKLLGM
jgi:hypothetical protein